MFKKSYKYFLPYLLILILFKIYTRNFDSIFLTTIIKIILRTFALFYLYYQILAENKSIFIVWTPLFNFFFFIIDILFNVSLGLNTKIFDYLYKLTGKKNRWRNWYLLLLELIFVIIKMFYLVVILYVVLNKKNNAC